MSVRPLELSIGPGMKQVLKYLLSQAGLVEGIRIGAERGLECVEHFTRCWRDR